MVEPVVDASGEGARVFGGEYAALVERKLGGGGQVAVGENRRYGLLEGFQRGKSLYLNGRAMDIQICLGSQFAQLFACVKSENRFVVYDAFFVETMRFLFETGSLRALTGKVKLDAVGIAGVAHGFQ